jgi:uncharacterized iron-regulated protein
MSPSERKTFSKENMPYTNVSIYLEERLLASANAWVGPEDQFKKRIGVCLALKRALRSTNFTRKERKEIYDKMFNRDNIWNKKTVHQSIIRLVSTNQDFVEKIAQELNMTPKKLKTFLKV